MDQVYLLRYYINDLFNKLYIKVLLFEVKLPILLTKSAKVYSNFIK